jgi:hypothetical protein
MINYNKINPINFLKIFFVLILFILLCFNKISFAEEIDKEIDWESFTNSAIAQENSLHPKVIEEIIRVGTKLGAESFNVRRINNNKAHVLFKIKHGKEELHLRLIKKQPKGRGFFSERINNEKAINAHIKFGNTEGNLYESLRKKTSTGTPTGTSTRLKAAKQKAAAARQKAEAARQKAEAARQKAEAARQKAEAAKQKAAAARQKAEAANQKAEAARQKAEAAKRKSPTPTPSSSASQKRSKQNLTSAAESKQRAVAANQHKQTTFGGVRKYFRELGIGKPKTKSQADSKTGKRYKATKPESKEEK